MGSVEERLKRLEVEIERRLLERFAALRDEFDRLRLEADRRWAGFLERFDQGFSGIVPAEFLEEGAAPGGAKGGGPRGSVSVEEARSLDAAGNQVDALHRFLDLCGERASRAAVLVSRSGTLSVWKAVGFSRHGFDDETVRRITIEAGAGPGPLSAVFEGTSQYLPGGNAISSRLEASDAVQAVVYPMVVREKVSGAVYADCVAGEEERFDPEGIALLTFLAGLVIDRLASRKLKPAPALRPLSGRPEKAAPEEDISDLGIPRPREIPLTPREPAASFAAPARPPEEPSHIEFESTSPRAEAVSPTPPPAAPRPMWEAPGVSERVPGRAAESAPSAPAWKPDVAPAPVVSSAPGLRRLGGPLAPADGDERREEARRFAKLLVSEIKLYNERTVQEGREQGNLYERLKEDIDRSRQMYDERIPEDVRAATNFFYDELVRTLADGRPEALGM